VSSIFLDSGFRRNGDLGLRELLGRVFYLSGSTDILRNSTPSAGRVNPEKKLILFQLFQRFFNSFLDLNRIIF